MVIFMLESLSHPKWFFFISIFLFQAIVSLDGKGVARAGTALATQPPAPSATCGQSFQPFEEQPGATCSVVQAATSHRN